MSDISNIVESLNNIQMKMILDKIGTFQYRQLDDPDIFVLYLGFRDSGKPTFRVLLDTLESNKLRLSVIFNENNPFIDHIPASFITLWNTFYTLFSKLCVRQDGIVVLEASHFLAGGVTIMSIVKFIATFESDLEFLTTELLNN